MIQSGSVLNKTTGVLEGTDESANRVVIVGMPNVGKSALFNRLTGKYVTVSNYPGTTVEVSSGRCRCLGERVEVVDTPGMYSLLPVSQEERVAREILLAGRPKAVLHVIDAKNIDRMLGLTLQLAQAGLPVILVLNMSDEARELGIRISVRRLEQALGLPVVATVATSGRGMAQLAERIHQLNGGASNGKAHVLYDGVLAEAIGRIAQRLAPRKGLSSRLRAELLLQEDAQERKLILAEDPDGAGEVLRLVAAACRRLEHSPHYHLAMALRRNVQGILAGTVTYPPPRRSDLRERLSRLCMNPWTGLPLLAVVLYFGLYGFVGKFGAGTCVNFLENTVFGRYVSPLLARAVEAVVPWPILADLFTGEYGIFTLGIRYAIALILPIVGTFFLAFSILEDSGYLPRLAMLIDRLFKRIGLNGRAVIPLVLGFGCDTMATLVTRTLETRRERIIATMLLALAVPCSAQMGLIIALLAGRPWALAVWGTVVLGVFLVAGWLAARLLPGQPASFYMELPPLRLPRIGNVLVKTYTRIAWYLREVLPMFIIASVLIWLGQITGVFGLLVSGLEPVVRSIGLPKESAVAFLFGFFRRDYGAAGLFTLQRRGLLNGNQLAVAAITLTLFLPCIAQFLVMRKERGWKATLWLCALVCTVAYSVGFLVNATFGILGVRL